MMDLDGLSPEERGMHDAIVQALKKLRQRGGLFAERPDFPLELLGARNWDDLQDIVLECLASLETAEAAALGYAFIADLGTVKSVIERRKEYAQIVGVSVSTVEREEEVALHQLAFTIRRVVVESDPSDLIADAKKQVDFATWALNRFSKEEADASRRISAELDDLYLRISPILKKRRNP